MLSWLMHEESEASNFPASSQVPYFKVATTKVTIFSCKKLLIFNTKIYNTNHSRLVTHFRMRQQYTSLSISTHPRKAENIRKDSCKNQESSPKNHQRYSMCVWGTGDPHDPTH